MSADVEEETGRGTIEEALELLCIVGFMTEGHYSRLMDELKELRELADERRTVYVPPELRARMQDALNVNRAVMLGKLSDINDPFASTFERHRARFLAEAGAVTQIVPEWAHRIRTVLGPDGPEITLETLERPSQYTDERSRAQIAACLAHRIRAADDRNARNLARWHSGLKAAWELENIGTRRVRSTGASA